MYDVVLMLIIGTHSGLRVVAWDDATGVTDTVPHRVRESRSTQILNTCRADILGMGCPKFSLSLAHGTDFFFEKTYVILPLLYCRIIDRVWQLLFAYALLYFPPQ